MTSSAMTSIQFLQDQNAQLKQLDKGDGQNEALENQDQELEVFANILAAKDEVASITITILQSQYFRYDLLNLIDLIYDQSLDLFYCILIQYLPYES